MPGSALKERIGQRRARKIAAVIVLLIGVVLFVDRLAMVHYGLTSTEWPAVTGQVSEFEIRPIGDARSGGTWSLQISYDYQVEGQVYSGSRVRFARSIPKQTQFEVDEAAVRFEPGNTVRVYHHPRRPEISVLETGLHRSGWMGLVLAMLLMVVAVVFWVVPTRVVRGKSGQGT